MKFLLFFSFLFSTNYVLAQPSQITDSDFDILRSWYDGTYIEDEKSKIRRMEGNSKYFALTGDFLFEDILKGLKEDYHQYLGQSGYRDFAQKYFRGKMDMCYKSMFVSLPSEVFKALNWGYIFKGSTMDFWHYRANLVKKDIELLEYFQGKEGLEYFARRFQAGNVRMAYRNAKTALSKDELSLLNWPDPSKKYIESDSILERELSRIHRAKLIDTKESVKRSIKK